MNNIIEATSQAGPINKRFIAKHIHQLLIESKEDPDLSWLYPLFKTAIVETTLIHTRGNQRKAGALLSLHRLTVHTYYRAYKKWQERQKG